MGSRGANSGAGGSSGVNEKDIVSTESLWSAPGKRQEINEAGDVLKKISDIYGINVNDAQLAKLKGRGKSVMAYFDSDGNIAVNQNYFDSKKMTQSYDDCGDFHPSRGKKSGIEAVVAHESGHMLASNLRGVSEGDIISRAARAAGYGRQTARFRRKISGYSANSNSEAIAEAFADVYCNGKKAKKESRAIVDALNSALGKKGL